jgi:cytochrome b
MRRMKAPERVPVQVWDLPVRAVHWALAVLFAFQVTSAYLGGDWMRWHAYSGYAILTLVVFRVSWGFAGSRHARFAQFLASPAAVLRFLPQLASREPLPYVGHNPLAGWMVVALLVCLLLQAGSGLFANDGAGFEGPLARLVTLELSGALSQFHRANVKVLTVLIGLHVAAAIFHAVVRRENLIGAMLTGIKRVPLPESVGLESPGTLRILILLALSLVFVYVVVGLGR